MGKRTTRSSYAFEHWVPEHDALIVERLRNAGAILVGKTTTPEFAHSSFTRSPLWGHTLNPWSKGRTSGGSSGGSAVAVATGCVSLAEGTDMGGSARIPAALCGVVGLKPSPGRIPMEILSTVFDQISHFGPLARTVDDCALFMSVAEGPDDRDVQSQMAAASIARPVSGDVSGLKIVSSNDLGFYHVEPEVLANFSAVTRCLEEQGAVVEAVQLGWQADVVISWLQYWSVHLAAAFGDALDTHRAKMDPDLVEFMEMGLRVDAVTFKRLEDVWTRQWNELSRVFEEYDVLICPTMSRSAPMHDANDTDFEGVDKEGCLHGLDMTSPFNNLARCPALSAPSGLTRDGLPTAVQIVGNRFDDPVTFRIARAIEKHRPWPSWSRGDRSGS